MLPYIAYMDPMGNVTNAPFSCTPNSLGFPLKITGEMGGFPAFWLFAMRR